MAKIPARSAAAMFEETLDWPYKSPGVTDDRGKTLGIDCSGEWVRVYRKYGLKLDHGSNSQFRRFCSQTGQITSPSDLRPGMAVFKLREWKADQKSHRDYGTQPGDLYHVGCVTGINPLRIVHATPPTVKAYASNRSTSGATQYRTESDVVDIFAMASHSLNATILCGNVRERLYIYGNKNYKNAAL